MIKRESFFSIIIGLFLLIISPLIVHAAPEEKQPVKAGEYHCVSYPGIGTRVLTLFREPDGTVYFSLEGRNGYGLKNKDAFNYNSITKHRLKLYTMRKSQGMRYTSLRKKKIKPDLPNLLN